MEYMVKTWGRNNEKYWIRNLKDQSNSMQITNNLFPIWARALLHNHNPEVTLDHPPATKHFVWIKKNTTKLEELKGIAPENTNIKEPPKSPSPLPNIPLGDYPRDLSLLPNNPLEELRKETSAPPPPTLPENLAWMAASEFILDAAIQFKLGHAPPSESLTNSNLVAKRPGC
ncbi:hypothetical protein PCASD_26488 [Puccinia coronata f. sp. avenae]|uniref:Uncharacterized protein n=1 Tax=Puccinia coronata f. sp. avenae TaxID=200324 RepID=A0A2N5RUT3_9BASI|nr:hypothetical protein PCASD_26488 [Puccinia coronata f. sp. avenae]